MKLCRLHQQIQVKIIKVPDDYKERLDSFGIYPENSIVYTGLSVHQHRIILSEERILAVPNVLCEVIEI